MSVIHLAKIINHHYEPVQTIFNTYQPSSASTMIMVNISFRNQARSRHKVGVHVQQGPRANHEPPQCHLSTSRAVYSFHVATTNIWYFYQLGKQLPILSLSVLGFFETNSDNIWSSYFMRFLGFIPGPNVGPQPWICNPRLYPGPSLSGLCLYAGWRLAVSTI